MAKETILVVEDENDIQELIRYNLAKEGYRITLVSNGAGALRTARANLPDLILLDLLLPGMDGLEICRQLKGDPKTSHIPVLMVTAKGEEADVVAGLELGADDYITKPFSPRVLLARVRTALRRKVRAQLDETQPLKAGPIVNDPGRHAVLVKGKPITLTFTEFRLLQVLARRPGWVFTRQQIVDAVRGEDYPVTDRAVDVQVVGLRKKLGEYGDLIETVRGVGYRFKE